MKNKILIRLNKIVEDYSFGKAKDTRLLVLESSRSVIEYKIEEYVKSFYTKTYTIENNDISPGNAKFVSLTNELIPYCSNNYIVPENVKKYVYINIVLNNGKILFYDFYTTEKK